MQGFPDAVNQPNFPSILLDPEDTYKHTVVYSFHNTTPDPSLQRQGSRALRFLPIPSFRK